MRQITYVSEQGVISAIVVSNGNTHTFSARVKHGKEEWALRYLREKAPTTALQIEQVMQEIENLYA